MRPILLSLLLCVVFAGCSGPKWDDLSAKKQIEYTNECVRICAPYEGCQKTVVADFGFYISHVWAVCVRRECAGGFLAPPCGNIEYRIGKETKSEEDI